jgi:hypothetical protein
MTEPSERLEEYMLQIPLPRMPIINVLCTGK